MLRYVSVLIIVLSLHGCATPSRESCQATAWYDAGYHDGLEGRVSRSVAAQSEACASSGASSPRAMYDQGRNEGLKHFCTPRVGFGLGKEGTNYEGVCPANAEQDFLLAYERGRAVFASQLQVRRLKEILEVNTSELQHLTVSVQERESELLSSATGQIRRGVLLLEVNDLRATLAMVEEEISGIEAALEEENRRLEKLREGNPQR